MQLLFGIKTIEVGANIILVVLKSSSLNWNSSGEYLLRGVNSLSASIIKLIGHSDFSITENVYTHKDLEELQKAIDLLN